MSKSVDAKPSLPQGEGLYPAFSLTSGGEAVTYLGSKSEG